MGLTSQNIVYVRVNSNSPMRAIELERNCVRSCALSYEPTVGGKLLSMLAKPKVATIMLVVTLKRASPHTTTSTAGHFGPQLM